MKDARASKAEVSRERRRRYRRGQSAEWLAIIMLTGKGYHILGRRVTTAAGEIDIVAARRRRLAFVEVKQRATLEAAHAALMYQQRLRIHRAADIWLARHPNYQDHEIGFDLVLVLPWRLPQHLINAV